MRWTVKTPDPNWDMYTPAPGSDLPAKRTGHVCVTYGERIYLCVDCVLPCMRLLLTNIHHFLLLPARRFGGTDGLYHYNDTWQFDVPTRTWKEVTCIGFIPVPREGHAAALVDDVMYVFGGRGVDGKDLGDLAAFKISSASSRLP